MIVNCPHCGKPMQVNGLGRKRLNIPLKNVLESLQAHRNVRAAACELGCSPSYIFGVLKTNGLKLEGIVKKVDVFSCSAGTTTRNLG
jgi:hypothetical protein